MFCYELWPSNNFTLNILSYCCYDKAYLMIKISSLANDCSPCSLSSRGDCLSKCVFFNRYLLIIWHRTQFDMQKLWPEHVFFLRLLSCGSQNHWKGCHSCFVWNLLKKIFFCSNIKIKKIFILCFSHSSRFRVVVRLWTKYIYYSLFRQFVCLCLD